MAISPDDNELTIPKKTKLKQQRNKNNDRTKDTSTPDCSSLCHVGLHNGEEPLDPDGNPHAGHVPLLGVEHPNELVVSSSSCHAPDLDGLALLVLVLS